MATPSVVRSIRADTFSANEAVLAAQVLAGGRHGARLWGDSTGEFRLAHKAQDQSTGTVAIKQSKGGKTEIGGKADAGAVTITARQEDGVTPGAIILDGVVTISGGLAGGALTGDVLSDAQDGSMQLVFETVTPGDPNGAENTKLVMADGSWVWDRYGGVVGTTKPTLGASLQVFSLDRDGALTVQAEGPHGGVYATHAVGTDGALTLKAVNADGDADAFAWLSAARTGAVALETKSGAAAALAVTNAGTGSGLSVATGASSFAVENDGTLTVTASAAEALVVGASKAVVNMDGSLSVASGQLGVDALGRVDADYTGLDDAVYAFDFARSTAGKVFHVASTDMASSTALLVEQAANSVLEVAGGVTSLKYTGGAHGLDVYGNAKVRMTMNVDKVYAIDGTAGVEVGTSTLRLRTDAKDRLNIGVNGAATFTTSVAAGGDLQAVKWTREGATTITTSNAAATAALSVYQNNALASSPLLRVAGSNATTPGGELLVEYAGLARFAPTGTGALKVLSGGVNGTATVELDTDGGLRAATGKLAVTATGETAIADTADNVTLDVTKPHALAAGTVLRVATDAADATAQLLSIANSAAEQVAVSQGGKVEFKATGQPTADVDVAGVLRVQTALVAEALVDDVDRSTKIVLSGADETIQLFTATAERVAVSGTGVVTLSQTTAGAGVASTLDVAGAIKVDEYAIMSNVRLAADGNTAVDLSGDAFDVQTAGTQRLNVSATGVWAATAGSATWLDVDAAAGVTLTAASTTKAGDAYASALVVKSTTLDAPNVLDVRSTLAGGETRVASLDSNGTLYLRTAEAVDALRVGTEGGYTAKIAVDGSAALATDKLTVSAAGLVSMETAEAANQTLLSVVKKGQSGTVLLAASDLVAADLATAADTNLLRVQRTVDNLGTKELQDLITVTGDGVTHFTGTANPLVETNPGSGDGLYTGGDVVFSGDCRFDGTVNILGDVTVTNVATQVSDQMVIDNTGTGPALELKQTGNPQPVLVAYDEDGLFPAGTARLQVLKVDDKGHTTLRATGLAATNTALRVQSLNDPLEAGAVAAFRAECLDVTEGASWDAHTETLKSRFEVDNAGHVTSQATTLASDILLHVIDTSTPGAAPVADNAAGSLAKLENANYALEAESAQVSLTGTVTTGHDGVADRAAESIILAPNSANGATITCGGLTIAANGTNSEHFLACQGFTTETVERYDSEGQPLGLYLTNDYSGIFDRAVACRAIDVTSDRRLKANIAPIAPDDATALIKRLQPKSYTWVEGGRKAWGLIAQEIVEHTDAEVLVNPVSAPGLGAEQPGDPEGVKLTVDYVSLVPQLVAALQSAFARIEELEAKVNA